jgi:hypothetical protein
MGINGLTLDRDIGYADSGFRDVPMYSQIYLHSTFKRTRPASLEILTHSSSPVIRQYITYAVQNNVVSNLRISREEL